MITLQIENMTCGHCVKAISNAVLTADEHAKVEANVAQKQVAIESQLDTEQIISLLQEEGYNAKILA